jgi:hypothetical protein
LLPDHAKGLSIEPLTLATFAVPASVWRTYFNTERERQDASPFPRDFCPFLLADF